MDGKGVAKIMDPRANAFATIGDPTVPECLPEMVDHIQPDQPRPIMGWEKIILGVWMEMELVGIGDDHLSQGR
jgi:hypothetical protein